MHFHDHANLCHSRHSRRTAPLSAIDAVLQLLGISKLRSRLPVVAENRVAQRRRNTRQAGWPTPWTILPAACAPDRCGSQGQPKSIAVSTSRETDMAPHSAKPRLSKGEWSTT
jgi:hypothetical protein